MKIITKNTINGLPMGMKFKISVIREGFYNLRLIHPNIMGTSYQIPVGEIDNSIKNGDIRVIV